VWSRARHVGRGGDAYNEAYPGQPMDGLLFTDGELRLALQHQAERLRAAVEAVPEEHLLQADVDEWVAALAEEFYVEAPELQLGQMYREPAKEIKVDVSHDPGRYFSPYTTDRRINGYRVVVRVPFTGDKGVFELRPNQFTFNPPRARVDGNELALTLEYPHDKQPDIDSQVNGTIGTIEQWLGWSGGEIESFNRALEQHARSAIAGRRQRIEQREQHLATSSIPERRPGDAKTYIPDVIVRRPAPKLPTAKTNGAGVQLEPVLEDRIFEHILSIVRMQAREMERAPKTYVGMDEEARRDLFLATLNTHYEGRGSAEAFNVNGKTDILIRYEDKNLFIAECKFWQGAKGFTDAIDQLFGYASWRDTKLALIMFVREKGLTEIVDKGRDALAAHAQFVAWQDSAGETELRGTVSWPGDDRRHADLNVFFVHTPT
jgi:hypothetical protein